jgi:GDP-L-fucose synthase
MTPLEGRPVLVTGASGLVGTHLVRRLLAEGARVRATVHHRPPAVADPRIKYVRADLTLVDDCRRVVEGRQAVFMCAASTAGAAVMTATPMVHVTPNVVMNAQMLEAAYQAGVQKFLWLSSTTGYPPSGSRPVTEDDMFDGEPFEKYFFVGWMKRFTEVLCRMYGEKLPRPMTTIVLRPTNIYGPHDKFDPALSHVTPALIRKVVERQDPIEVWGTGDDVRDLIYVEDMIDAMILAIEKIESFAALNIGSGEGVSVKDILKTLLELDGYQGARVVFDPSKPTMIPMRLIDMSRARAMLGFVPRTDLREGLRRTLRWYRESLTAAPAPDPHVASAPREPKAR